MLASVTVSPSVISFASKLIVWSFLTAKSVVPDGNSAGAVGGNVGRTIVGMFVCPGIVGKTIPVGRVTPGGSVKPTTSEFEVAISYLVVTVFQRLMRRRLVERR